MGFIIVSLKITIVDAFDYVHAYKCKLIEQNKSIIQNLNY